MHSRDDNGSSAGSAQRGGHGPERDVISALAARVDAIDSLLRATTSVVDEKTLKELRRTIEALSKRDPKFEQRVTNKVDVVADRVETIARTVSTSSAALAAKDGEIAQLRRELEAGLSRANPTTIEVARGANPKELAEIKIALADLSKLAKEKLPRGLENRVDELADKFALLAQRVDTVSTTISTAAAGLAGRDGDLNALRRTVEADSDRVTAELADLRRAIDPSPVAELRLALKELAAETARQQHSIRQLISQKGASVDALAGELDSVTSSLTSTTDRVSDNEAGLAAFRTYFEDAGTQLSSHLAEHQRSLTALSARAAALEQANDDAARGLDERLAGVTGKVDDIAGRLDSVLDAVTATASKVSGTEEVVAALGARLEERGGLLSALVAEHEQSLAAFGDRTTALEQAYGDATRALETQISAASDKVDELAGLLEPLSAAVATADERIDARDVELQALEDRFHDASSRVESLVAELSGALAELPDPTAIARALEVRIDELADGVTSSTDRLSAMEAALTEQIRESTSTSTEVERFLVEARGTARDISDQLDAFTSSLAALSARTAALEQSDTTREFDERLAGVTGKVDDIAGRLDFVLDAVTATASKVSGTEEVVAAFGARLEDASGVKDEVVALRAYIDERGENLGSRLMDQERLLAALGDRTGTLEQAAENYVVRDLVEHISTTNDRVEELATKLAAADQGHADTASEIARVAAILEVDRASFRARLDALAAAAEEPSDPGSSDELERRIAALQSAFEAERVSFQAQFEAIANALASNSQHSAFEQRLDELGRRLDEAEQHGAAIASKVSHAALLPTALRSLEARLDELAPDRRRGPSERTDGSEASPPELVPALETANEAVPAVIPLRLSEP
jgi:chromosome segregation ATPase